MYQRVRCAATARRTGQRTGQMAETEEETGKRQHGSGVPPAAAAIPPTTAAVHPAAAAISPAAAAIRTTATTVPPTTAVHPAAAAARAARNGCAGLYCAAARGGGITDGTHAAHGPLSALLAYLLTVESISKKTTTMAQNIAECGAVTALYRFVLRIASHRIASHRIITTISSFSIATLSS
jgi:hypothetical protein